MAFFMVGQFVMYDGGAIGGYRGPIIEIDEAKRTICVQWLDNYDSWVDMFDPRLRVWDAPNKRWVIAHTVMQKDG